MGPRTYKSDEVCFHVGSSALLSALIEPFQAFLQ
jgi:hypothetical protein